MPEAGHNCLLNVFYGPCNQFFRLCVHMWRDQLSNDYLYVCSAYSAAHFACRLETRSFRHLLFVRQIGKIPKFSKFPSGWWRGTVVERRSLIGELSLSCARPAADG